MPGPKQGDEDRALEWFHIDDFTPGCYDNSFISLAQPKLSAPMGAADAIATFCCAALGPQLGLGPLPALVASETAPTLPGTATSAFLTGFAVNPGLNSVNDELILIIEADDGTDHFVWGYSDVPAVTSLNKFLNDSATTQVGLFGSPYPTWTRMTPDGTGNPPPVLVFPAVLNNDARGPDGHLYVYPKLTARTTFDVTDLITGTSGGSDNSSITGQVICYGSRVIVLVGVDYTWPAQVGNTGVNTNENINFTNPPESGVYGNQMDILAAEIPWGYGAFGTVSVGELMLIKKNGGGLIIYGDIDAITSAIEMPGVQAVGDFVGKAAAGPLGLVYCSEQRGAWTWNGGNTAQKISQQLRDDFYDASSATGILSNNYGFDVSHWQNWILFSNNYLYDLDHGGWWQMYPGDGNGNGAVTGHTFWWWYEGRFGNVMYAAPLKYAAGEKWWYKFDSETPAPHWQWQSLPIEVVQRGDRVLNVRQIIVSLSDPSGSGNATATVSIPGTSFSETVTGIEQYPSPFRLNVGVLGLNHIVLNITGDNAVSGSSPILHSIDVGYQVRAGVAPSD